MKRAPRLPGAEEFGIDVSRVDCPLCLSSSVQFEGMTGGAANELLMRCQQCSSFFFVLKDPEFLMKSEAQVTN
jgi:hypothetical protein